VNHFAFLLGALSAISLRRIGPARIIRWSLIAIGVVTIGMALTSEFVTWMFLRALVGLANAWAQIFALNGEQHLRRY